METGTLKELNVKPGDVVECVEARTDLYTVGKRYLADDEGNIWNNWGWVDPTPHSKFRIISRAAQATPAPDLTAITTPFGLLDESTQQALRAHGGTYEMWDGAEWDEGIPSWYGDCTYRVKPGPVIEIETMKITNADGMPMAYVAVTTRDGKPDWSTLQVQDD